MTSPLFSATRKRCIGSKMKQTEKRYKCTRCGYISKQTTNHFGNTWSWGHVNCCPECPPWAKYAEYGGGTIWECLDQPDNLTEEDSNGTNPAI